MKTALIVVDAINDFFHPDGSNYHPEYDPILEKVKEMLDLARQHKIMIVHTMENHIPGGHPEELKFFRVNIPSSSGATAHFLQQIWI
jgi:nicotinamidase-related amidase